MSNDPRLAELRTLKKGWHGSKESGEPVHVATLDGLEHLLPHLRKEGMPKPYVYATLDGKIQIEWEIGGFMISAVFHATYVGDIKR